MYLSQGDVSLGGQDQHSSYFQGMIYTSGNLSASNVTVLGSAVANATHAASGNITLQNARFVLDSKYSQMSFGQTLPHNNPNARYLEFNPGTGSSGWNLGIFGMGPGGNLGPLGGPTKGTTNHHLIGGDATPKFIQVPVTVSAGTPTTVTVLGLSMTVDGSSTPGAQRMIRMLHDHVKAQAPHSLLGSSAWDESLFEQTAPDIPVQIMDIVQRVQANPFTSSQTINTKGALLSINLNQFIDLADQMQVLYWAPLDPSKQLGN